MKTRKLPKSFLKKTRLFIYFTFPRTGAMPIITDARDALYKDEPV